MLRHIVKFVRAEDGQDLVEYALLAALIAIASVVALNQLGPTISSFYGLLNDHLTV